MGPKIDLEAWPFLGPSRFSSWKSHDSLDSIVTVFVLVTVHLLFTC